MAGILELLRGTTDPTTPGTGLGDIYFKGASDAAMLLYFRRPDGTVVELAPSSGGLVLPSAGGTGIANNNSSTLAITGAFATTFTVTGTTGVTLPTTGTLSTLAGSETFSNKTLSGYVLTGNVTSTGNPSLNIGSGALTAGSSSLGGLTITGTGVITVPQTGATQAINITANAASNAVLKLDATADNGYGASVNYRSKTTGGVSNAWAVGTGITGGTNAFEFYDDTATRFSIAIGGGVSTNGGALTAGSATVSGDFATTADQFIYSSNGGGVRSGWLLKGSTGELISYSAGVPIVTLNASGMNGVLGATTPAAASVTTLTASTSATITATESVLNLTATAGSGNNWQVISGGGTLGAAGNMYFRQGTSGQSPLQIASGAANATVYIGTTSVAVTGALSATGDILWGSASQGRVSHDGTNAYFDNTVSGATYFRTNGTTLMGTWQASGLAVTGALSATGTIYGSGGSLAVAGNGTFIASNLSTGRLLSGGGANVNAIHTYFDATAYEISAGSSGVFVSGITVAARSYAGTGGEGVAVWQRGAEVARFSPTGLAVTGALSATTTITTGGYTVGTLPAGTVGMRAYVTDALLPTYNGALTGGGAVTVPVFYNGAAWVSA